MSIIYSISLSNIIFIIYSYFVNYKFLENRFYRFPFSVHIIFWVLSVLALGGVRFMWRVAEDNNIGKDSIDARRDFLLLELEMHLLY